MRDLDAFGRLRRLIGEAPPAAGLEPIHLHLGEQRLAVPADVLERLETGTGWSQYPPLGGTADLREAYAGWLARRFRLGAALASGRIAYEPIPGSKQGVAATIHLAVAHTRGQGGDRPVIVVPDLCYPTYQAAALAAGAGVATFDSESRDPSLAIEAALERVTGAVAAIVVCNPANPTGAVLAGEELARVARLAGRRGASLIVDECYLDLWLDDEVDGALGLADQDPPLCPVVVLHTLSKRSGAPGLRSGFLAGDPVAVARYAEFNRVCGVSLSRPVCATSAELWRDAEHLDRLRDILRGAWRVADAILGDLPGYRRPPAGFFLWLPVDNGESAARALWLEAAVLTMPGAYLAADGLDVRQARAAGVGRLRIALVHSDTVLATALARLRDVVSRRPPLSAERDRWNPPCLSAC